MATKKSKYSLALTILLCLLSSCSVSDKKKTQAAQATPTQMSGTEQQETAAAAAESARVVYFEFDKYDLTPESRAILQAHAEKLKLTFIHTRLEGHADERGSREYNIAMGDRRANVVRDFLVLQGVKAASLEPVSYGEELPVATGHDEASWSQNRRVEIKY